MRWGLNDMTKQIMEVQSIKCLEKHDAGHQWQLRLGPCNADQESKHQTWKFEFYNPHYTNSTKLTRLTQITILDWHRNYSIYDIPFPPYPDIIQRKWNSQYDTLDEEISAFLTDQNSTEFDSLTPLETTTQNTENTTPMENSSIYVPQESDLNQNGNRTETSTNNEENDKKINNDGNILITQPEDGEKAGITESIDNLIVDEEFTTTTTPKLQASSSSTLSTDHTTTLISSTTSSATQETTSFTPISSSTFSITQKTTTTTPMSSSTSSLTQKTTIRPNITATSTTPATTSSTSTTTIQIITSSSTTPQTFTEKIETTATTTTLAAVLGS
jgi:hypothetical protein